jgi:hypothetical protein
MVSPQIFDHYGRMLAYVNANYEKADPVGKFQKSSVTDK